MEATIDTNTFITRREDGWVYYKNVLDNREWRVSGTCVACGLCEEPRPVGVHIEQIPQLNGNVIERELEWFHEPGTPNACLDLDYENRLDIPIMPKLKDEIPTCSLTAEWL